MPEKGELFDRGGLPVTVVRPTRQQEIHRSPIKISHDTPRTPPDTRTVRVGNTERDEPHPRGSG